MSCKESRGTVSWGRKQEDPGFSLLHFMGKLPMAAGVCHPNVTGRQVDPRRSVAIQGSRNREPEVHWEKLYFKKNIVECYRGRHPDIVLLPLHMCTWEHVLAHTYACAHAHTHSKVERNREMLLCYFGLQIEHTCKCMHVRPTRTHMLTLTYAKYTHTYPTQEVLLPSQSWDHCLYISEGMTNRHFISSSC